MRDHAQHTIFDWQWFDRMTTALEWPMPTLVEIRRSLHAKYPNFVDSVARVPIDPANVPLTLRAYIPYAEVWGVADDWDREQLAERAPQAAKDDLVALVAAIDDDLDAWLAGRASYETPPSPEYIAFSAMRMAADFVQRCRGSGAPFVA